MYIHGIERQDDYIILKVRGSKQRRDEFVDYISEIHSINTEETVDHLGMLVLTFDYLPKEQTPMTIRRTTNKFLQKIEEEIQKYNLEKLNKMLEDKDE